MKKSTLLIILLVLVITAASLLLWHNARLEAFCLPFTAEEVESVTISSVWNEYKQIEDRAGIETVIAAMNKIKISPDSDNARDSLAPGNYGYNILFQTKDGIRYTYGAVKSNSSFSVFTDAAGDVYKIYGFSAVNLWNGLDYEIQTKDPANFG